MEFLKAKKSQKRGLYAQDPCGADVAQRGHVATPQGLTQTHVGTYMVQSVSRAKRIWPTGIVGLEVKLKRGILCPMTSESLPLCKR